MKKFLSSIIKVSFIFIAYIFSFQSTLLAREEDDNISPPKIFVEPVFTKGDSNCVYYYFENITDSVPVDGVFIPLEECEVEVFAFYIGMEGEKISAGSAVARANIGHVKFPHFEPDKFNNAISKQIQYQARVDVIPKGKVGRWSEGFVFSTQDVRPPSGQINPFIINMLSNKNGWYNQPVELSVECTAHDESGIGSVTLYGHSEKDTAWVLYENLKPPDGLPGDDSVSCRKRLKIDDGSWTFNIGISDDAYDAISHGAGTNISPVWVKKSNDTLLYTSEALKVDTKAPFSEISKKIDKYQKSLNFEIFYSANDELSGLDTVYLYCLCPDGQQNTLKKFKKNDSDNQLLGMGFFEYTAKSGEGWYKFKIACIDSAGNLFQHNGFEDSTLIIDGRIDSLIVSDSRPEFGIKAEEGWTSEEEVKVKLCFSGSNSPVRVFLIINDVDTMEVNSPPEKCLIDMIRITDVGMNKIKAIAIFPDSNMDSLDVIITFDPENPIIDSLNSEDGEITGSGYRKIYSEKLSININGHDSYSISGGQVFIADSLSSIVLFDKKRIVTSFSITIPPNRPSEIYFAIYDSAGRLSEKTKLSDTIYYAQNKIYYEPDEDMIDLKAYPNPFYVETDQLMTIETKRKDIKKLQIFDLFGNLVLEMNDQDLNGHIFKWNGRNGRGEPVACGGYLCIVDGIKKPFKIAVLKRR